MKSRLAIHGGAPVRNTLLPYGRHTIEVEDIQAVVAVLRSGWLTTGPKVEEFEKALAERVGAPHAVVFNSGTAALHAAVFAAGLGPGDEAVTTPLTFAATANCLLYQGATPVFADIRNDSLTIDPVEIERRLTPRTRALLPVDFAGHPADLEALCSIAKTHGLVMIEDAAHALGARYKRRNVGTWSDMTTFSFHPVKHVATGEGGAVTTSNEGYARKLRLFRNHGIDSDARRRQQKGSYYYEMVALGFNYRLPDIGCALGLSQLQRLEDNLRRRREIARAYNGAFHSLNGIVAPVVLPDAEPAWHLYTVRIDANSLKAGRDEVFQALRAENIGVNVHYIPVHLHPYYRDRFGHRRGDYPVAETAYDSLLTLPLFHGMTDQDVDDVVKAVNKVVEAYTA